MRKILLTLIIPFFIVAIPSVSHAQVPFGGLVVAEIPCTCSPFTWQFFAPLFLGPVPTAGPLAVPDTPFIFAYYYSLPTDWVLGFFTPGVEACWMYAVAGCFPLVVEGAVTPFAGTSL